eukprot:Sspe_Gene.119370::Locus_115121_Transcript_1_1_Confidence_1.000_Length_823::g.119370::m.119370
MKDWELEQALQDVQLFAKPKIELEQYATPPELAKHMLMTAERTYGDIEGKCVLDLGCGTGMLGIGAGLLEAGSVVGVDVDPDALRVAQENIDEAEVAMDLVRCDVFASRRRAEEGATCDGRLAPYGGGLPFRTAFDTVVLNPPFGANKDRQAKGIDLLFLHTALSLCSADGAVYSLHKSSTRDHIQQVGDKWGVRAEPQGEYVWNLSKTYKHQKKSTMDIRVDLWRFCHKSRGD